MHDFRATIQAAVKAEVAFLRATTGLKKLSGFGSDFRTLKGFGLELKVESRSIKETPNLFLEIWSRPGVQGGCFQSLGQSELYAHYFPRDNALFLYNTRELCLWLANYSKDKELVPVRNKGYTTYGLIIPRTLIQHLEKEPGANGFQLKPQIAARPEARISIDGAARVYRRV